MNDNWMDNAECIGEDLNIFFPEDEDGNTQSAKEICKACRTKRECAIYAIVHRIAWGIWGGLDLAGRKKMARFEPWLMTGHTSKPSLVGEHYKASTKPKVGTGMRNGRAVV